MTLHSLVHALPHLRGEQAPATHAGLAVPQRAIGARAELRIFLRRRRETWRSSLLALALANAAFGAWAYLVSRLG